jgi:hypothetical protein
MQTELTELRLAGAANRKRGMSRQTLLSGAAAHSAGECAAAEVVDAAFDEYTRIDVGTPHVTAPRADARKMTKQLIADITTQLGVLDHQRERLAALLREASV